MICGESAQVSRGGVPGFYSKYCEERIVGPKRKKFQGHCFFLSYWQRGIAGRGPSGRLLNAQRLPAVCRCWFLPWRCWIGRMTGRCNSWLRV